MSSAEQATPQGPRGDSNRDRGRGRGAARGNRNRGGGGDGAGRGGAGRGKSRGGGQQGAAPTPAQDSSSGDSNPTQWKTQQQQEAQDDDDAEVCFICANPITHHSVAPCGHSTCHLCALRLRALYKNKDCPHCRTAAPFVIFTDDPNKRFEEYTSKEITSTDDNIGIKYAGEHIVGDTVLLLRYNCPGGECDFAGLGWPDLHRHVRSVHHKKLCDLCTRNKKVFTHEHEMFTDKELRDHMSRGDDKPGAVDQTGFKGHPLCGFCGERFYDNDKLYEHCRSKHERCFICDRRDSRQPHYYRNYDALEEHFKQDHYICQERECLEKKFVVFDSELDLKAHQLSEHGNSLSKDVRRDARVVDISGFDFRSSYQEERGGSSSGGRGRGGRDGRGARGRDPNAEALPVSTAQPLRRDELAFQRQMAIAQSASSARPSAGPSSGTRPAGQTSVVQSRPSRPQQQREQQQQQQQQPIIDAMQNLSVSELSSLTPEQRASLTRHGAVIERASNLLGNDATKINQFRSYISNFNKGSMTADQLIDAFFALFSETSSNALGTLVREVSELFDDKNKGASLNRAWQNHRTINEDYPSLPGLGGMHGATTASSGWAAAASATPVTLHSNGGLANAQSRHSNHVLKLKNSTRIGGASERGLERTVASLQAGGSSSSSSSRLVPGTNAYAAQVRPTVNNSAAFPALPGAKKPATTSGLSGFTAAAAGGSSSSRPAPVTVPSASRSSGSTATTIARKVAGGSGSMQKPGNEDAFPALPAAPKPTTTLFGYGRGAVRRNFGQPKETGFNWSAGGGSGGASGSSSAQQAGGEGDADGAGGGKGKKKQKKQVLVQWG
ncbi:hypothetical protein GE21DRAFT_10519 [Neurospora crassa]|uniref:RING-type E3 ubiquitin transferase n=1 Tax=Neurospora crassa (strain ATCC 24698 / 74-OR23-1A / CBS 708.71 / DSM 1257 / FGSC 987) TaxID=367110 RepID=Q7S469_NEUCR|nr:C2H2 finger domain-containing protein [Neurospora crassa OR74A]EAA30286.1 C2H2 finger domain-containing protein [Neurospora crassa OR74A]KHE84064.1 hypothetical protein GE21DRAFT_10519 [Neurospora crassa]|eukprot:XP_959522.1 C2H2 finger domain-containing protein [Neurospora crassa OR74A]